MAKILVITTEDSLSAFRILGLEVLKIESETEPDYDKINPYSLLIVEEKLYKDLKQRFPEKIIFPLSGLKGENGLLKNNFQDFMFKAVSKRGEL
ncbi:MAG: hypothetical protein J7K37_05635 [Candidatus Omnitrophica bacterium]|nr:hypothetical protein [Candidatus Omnitrophota bacterium]